jgi:acetyl esterase/lipase
MQPHAGHSTVADGRSSNLAEDAYGRCLIPFDRREGLSLAQAAKIAGKSVDTVRLWCLNHDIGRRVGGGSWVVSRVALAMFLDDDRHALEAYLAGGRTHAAVAPYFNRLGLDGLLRDWARSS